MHDLNSLPSSKQKYLGESNLPQFGQFDWSKFIKSLNCFSIGSVQSVQLIRKAVDITLEVKSSSGHYMVRLANSNRHRLSELESAISFGALAYAQPGLIVSPVRSREGSYVLPVENFWPYEYLSITNYIMGTPMSTPVESVTRREILEFLHLFTKFAESISGKLDSSSGQWRSWTSTEFCRLYDIRSEIMPIVSSRVADFLQTALAALDEQFYNDPRIVHGDLSPRNILERTQLSPFTLIDLGHVGIGSLDFEIGNWCGAVLAGGRDPESSIAQFESIISTFSAAFDRPKDSVASMCALRLARGMIMAGRLVADPVMRLRRVAQLGQMLEGISDAAI